MIRLFCDETIYFEISEVNIDLEISGVDFYDPRVYDSYNVLLIPDPSTTIKSNLWLMEHSLL